ncbi:putative repeat protein (TIGR01451 family) [Agrococcus sp. UYP10]|uniref:hypothetical protein n=1 Tax=Agrococcus sp. UYP10 TaxID=1756355 RepID=UPI00339AA8D1
MRAEGRGRAPGAPAPRSRTPRHAAPRERHRGHPALAAAVAITTSLLAPLGAAPAAATEPPHGPDEVAATLTLLAEVDGGDGGDAALGEWMLEAAGPTPIRGASGDPSVTGTPVAAGAYALQVTGGRGGYSASAWSCTGGVLDGATLTLVAGDDVACAVVLDDHPVDLALTLDDGGAAPANGGAFDLTIGVHNLGARDVDLDEPVTVLAAAPVGAVVTAVPGGCSASAGIVTCGVDPAALAAGAGVVLSIALRFDAGATAGAFGTVASVSTEDDPAPVPAACGASNNVDCEQTELRYPTLTLVQVLATDDGGDATLADFALSASGPVEIGGPSGAPAVTVAPVPAGAYRLSAAGPAGYAAGAWSCTGGSLEGDTLTITGAVDVTCTIGRDDGAVDLQLTASGDEVVAVGSETGLSLLVRNLGARGVDDDESVEVVVALPTGMRFVSGAGCAADGGTVACAIEPAALGSGAAVRLELRVAIAADAVAGTLETATTVSTEDDPVPAGGCERPSNNAACLRTRVVAGSVTAQKSVWERVNGAWMSSDGTVRFGDSVQFRIVVRAVGEAPSTGVVLLDRLPDGLLVDAAARCSMPCAVDLDDATGTQRITIGTMEPGDVVTVTIEATVPGVPSQADGTTVRVAFDSAASLSSDNVESAPTNMVTLRASHALPAARRSGGEIPLGGIGLALALLVAGGLLLVRSRELMPR